MDPFLLIFLMFVLIWLLVSQFYKSRFSEPNTPDSPINWLICKDAPRWAIRLALYLKYAAVCAACFFALDLIRYMLGFQDSYLAQILVVIITCKLTIEFILLPEHEEHNEHLNIRYINAIIGVKKSSKIRPISEARALADWLGVTQR